jgi:5-methyltetrahydropteroyltriglutamate--homocysteine methyltransferase
MPIATNLGFSRVGPRRELKKALEQYWSGSIDENELTQCGRRLRARNSAWQSEARLDHIPSNDFSFYDHVLDTCLMVDAIPPRFRHLDEASHFDRYFAMARGGSERRGATAAMEMTKWFDTNYHYLVPEYEPGQAFRLASTKPVDEYLEAKASGIETRPVLLGPVSFLLLGKSLAEGEDPLVHLDSLLPVYGQLLERLAVAGAGWVQMDEPCLVADSTSEHRAAWARAYERLSDASGPRLLVATYFGDLGDNLRTALRLPVDALHVDLVRSRDQFDRLLASVPKRLSLSLGLVDGRNVWKTDLAAAQAVARRAVDALGPDRVMVGPSCSLLHVPVDLDEETELDDELRSWMAFGRQKLHEIRVLADALGGGGDAARGELAANARDVESRRRSGRTHNPDVRRCMASVEPAMLNRESPFAERRRSQRESLSLPPLPTTTIGSFPQTAEIRKARADHRRGGLSDEQYEAFLEKAMADTIRFQEQLGLDVLVHGEAERNDMVEYFGERLEGMAVTKNGWVQSYGSRCVKPPILFGDVRRRGPMTVGWATRAMACTSKPVKGMLTGPITILCWSFVRDDQPRSETCRQIALAIRDEVADLEAAGVGVIQIDEPALREGMPLRAADRESYLDWAVDAFRLASCGVRDRTQIHTHMCYCEFNDIIEAIARLDADVISIEASRSRMELLKAFGEFKYPNDIGPGVYDIHSPQVPTTESMRELLEKALEVLDARQIWVNPDCGLKTRRWEEVTPALANMVAAARSLRASHAEGMTGKNRAHGSEGGGTETNPSSPP